MCKLTKNFIFLSNGDKFVWLMLNEDNKVIVRLCEYLVKTFLKRITKMHLAIMHLYKYSDMHTTIYESFVFSPCLVSLISSMLHPHRVCNYYYCKHFFLFNAFLMLLKFLNLLCPLGPKIGIKLSYLYTIS